MSSTSTQMSGLSPQAARRIARTATGTVCVIAFSAAALSYAGLHHTAVAAGIHPTLAILVPVTVDGLILASMLSVLYAAMSGLSTRLPWTLVLLGVAASVGGNVLAAPDDLVSRIVHGAPPVILALVLELVLSVLRHRAGLPTPRQARRQRTSPAVTSGTLPASESEPVQAKGAPGRPARRPSPAAAAASVRPGSRRAQVAALLANDPHVSGAAVAQALGIDPADARRHLRALRSEQQPARATLTLATAGGA